MTKTLLFFCLISSSIFWGFSSTLKAQEVKGELVFDVDQTLFKEGDLIKGTIRIWPLENADLAQFKSLEKTILFQSLYLAQLDSVDLSENNADVVELKAKFFVKNTKISNLDFIRYNDIKIPISIKKIEIEDLKNKQEKFFVADQETGKTYWFWMIIAMAGVVFVALIIFRKKIRKYFENLTKREIIRKRKYFDELFRKANSRRDFEEIYKLKNEWLLLVDNQTPAHKDFFQILNSHQFKKEWSNEELIEVRTTFDSIRRSFES